MNVQRWLGGVALVAAGAGFWLLSPQGQGMDPGQKKLAPNQWLSWRWSFPEAQWDPAEADDAFRQAVLADGGNERTIEGAWTQQGPLNLGGRINVMQQDTAAPERIYVGAAAGGAWRSLDSGANWTPITEDFGHMAIGSLAIHPDSNEVLYLGTGDPQISGHPRIGNGVYKSQDGGDTWSHLGLTDQRIVSQLAIDPSDPSRVFAATMGNPSAPGPDRGLYRSLDAGETWEQVLFVGDSVGINDVRISSQTGTLLASAWHRVRTSTQSELVHESNQLYRSTDGGDTWELLDNPWGEGARCRIGIEEYAGRFVVNPVGADLQFSNLYRSTDDGNTWTPLVPEGAMPEGILGGFGWYFSKVRVNPWNPNDITVLGVELWNSLDGGASWERMGPEWWTYEVHADKHDLQWVGPQSLILATDGGAYRSDDHGETWTDMESMPISQFYHVTHIPQAPGWFTAGAQDNGTSTGNASVAEAWTRDRGGDGFTALYHPVYEDVRVATVQYGNFAFSLTEWSDEPQWNSWTEGIDEEDRKGWDSPVMFHPADPFTAWCATQRVYRMDDAPFGVWEPVSDDLTQGLEMGLSFRVVTTLAGSPWNENHVLAGTSDGQVWLTLDEGATWEPMMDGLPLRQVTDVAFDPFHPDSVTVTLNGYKDAVYTPHVFRAALGGAWQDASGDMPNHPVNDWRALDETTWVVATDFGVYQTSNAGGHWERVGDMPFIPVFELDVDTASSQLVAATFARSIQTFPLDSLVSEPEPVDTSTSAVLAPRPTHGLTPLNHPFHGQARFSLDRAWVGGTWEVWSLAGQRVDEGRISDVNLALSTQGWPRGGALFVVRSQDGTQRCAKPIVVRQGQAPPNN